MWNCNTSGMGSAPGGMWRSAICGLSRRHVRSSARSRSWDRTPELAHPRLADWRFFVVLRPFHRHVIFYEVAGDAVEMRRAMDGRRDLPRRLLEPPGTG